MLNEKPNYLFLNVYRNYVDTTKEYNKLERTEKLAVIEKTIQKLKVMSNDIYEELEKIQRLL